MFEMLKTGFKENPLKVKSFSPVKQPFSALV